MKPRLIYAQKGIFLERPKLRKFQQNFEVIFAELEFHNSEQNLQDSMKVCDR